MAGRPSLLVAECKLRVLDNPPPCPGDWIAILHVVLISRCKCAFRPQGYFLRGAGAALAANIFAQHLGRSRLFLLPPGYIHG